MTNRERVLASLRHEQPDVTPYNVWFTHFAHQKMVAYYSDPHFESMLSNCFTGVNADPAQPWVEVAPDIWEDPFGVQWNRSIDKDIGNVVNRRVTPENLDDYVFPSLDNPPSDADYDAVIRDNPGQFIVANLGFSLFERAWTLTGMEALMMAMVEEPAFAHKLFDRILEFNLQAVERACRHNVDAMYFGDDWGDQRGVMMGPGLWREFIKPRIREQYAAAKKHGKYIVIHSCGKVDELFPDLIEVGVDIFNPFQPEVMDPLVMKQAFGDRLTFFGGISTQKTLPYGTPDDTRAEVRRLIAEVGRDGGYIAAPAHSIPGDGKPENIAAMIEVLVNQGSGG